MLFPFFSGDSIFSRHTNETWKSTGNIISCDTVIQIKNTMAYIGDYTVSRMNVFFLLSSLISFITTLQEQPHFYGVNVDRKVSPTILQGCLLLECWYGCRRRIFPCHECSLLFFHALLSWRCSIAFYVLLIQSWDICTFLTLCLVKSNYRQTWRANNVPTVVKRLLLLLCHCYYWLYDRNTCISTHTTVVIVNNTLQVCPILHWLLVKAERE